MPKFKVTRTTTLTSEVEVEATNHIEAEKKSDNISLPDSSATLTRTSKVIGARGPLQFFTGQFSMVGFDVLLGDIIQPDDLVPIPRWAYSDSVLRPPLVLAKTTNRVGQVVTSHHYVFRAQPGAATPGYPADALEATGYRCDNTKLGDKIEALVSAIMTNMAFPVVPMFLVVSSKPTLSVYDRYGNELLDNDEKAVNELYMHIRDLPFLPCVLVNPSLRKADLPTKEAVQRVWEDMSPKWLELTTA